MDDRNKHKVMGQMNHQTADPKANASVFLFPPPHIFFNSILCRPANGTLAFAPTAQANHSGKIQRAVSANALTEHSDNKTDFLRILTNYKF